ncbi:MAG: short-chain dehydrogenase [Sphingomonas sp.]|nr:short-chain dehydrogenase [Sphingomonas sp.]
MSAPAVLVTGGARRLGATIARRLVDDGWRVVVHYHHAQDEAAALVRVLGTRTIAIGQDLGVAGAGDTLMLRAREALGGPVTAIVNNASLFDYDTPPDVSDDTLSRHHAVNLAAPVALANALARQEDLSLGAVVNILDQKVANLNPDFFAYSCSKVTLVGATAMLDQALGPRIAVNAVAPGLTLPSLDQTEAEYNAVAAINLLRRPVGADAVADAVAFLLRARGIGGQVVYVDNGQRFLPRSRDVMFATRGA